MSAVAALPTVADLLAQAARALAASDATRLDAEVLLGDVLGRDRAWLFAHGEATVPDAAAADFTALVARRAGGYPLAYLTGTREFWSLELAVDRHTLIPRPETELLVELALAALPETTPATLLELGVGSGAVSLAIARERTAAHITATDLCPHALAVAADNARRHGIGNVEFLRSDWFADVGPRRFSAIVSNPPYVDERDPALYAAPLRHEPRLALDGGPGGLAALARIVSGAGRHLAAGALLALEHGHDQGAAVRELMRTHGLVQVRTVRDAAGHERVTLGTWP